MYRIRFHGRGGQGIKTASRILGTAFFRGGFEVQDAPRYGAERRGAPVFAYVRAAREAINERGLIQHPDLAVVVDDTLVAVPAAGVLQGLDERAVLLIDSAAPADLWRHRLNLTGPILVLRKPEAVTAELLPRVGAACAGAAARLVGVISRAELEAAIDDELGMLGRDVAAGSREAALAAFEEMGRHAGMVSEREQTKARGRGGPVWVDLPLDPAAASAPTVHASLTSVQVRTGLWRTMRPVIDHSRCNRCWWVCSTFCPDNAITVNEANRPEIDYDHCKGCLVCVAQCPTHAIFAVPEETGALGEEAAK